MKKLCRLQASLAGIFLMPGSIFRRKNSPTSAQSPPRDLYLSKKIQLLSPADRATVNTRHPTLVWAKNDEAASYTVEITAGDPVETAKGITDTFYTVAKELSEWPEYRWDVYVYNKQGTQIGCSAGFFFHVAHGLP
jgi:hypothetical protein